MNIGIKDKNDMNIGIIAAMSEEIDFIKSHLQQVKEKKIKDIIFYFGNIANKSVVAVLSGVGKTNAAIATLLLIEKWSVDCIINIGTAASFSQSVAVGDVVVSTEVAHHDVDVTAFDYVRGQLPQLPAVFQADMDWIAILKNYQPDDFNINFGLIVSGDQFIHEKQQKENILQHFSQSLACDMEASSIAQVCFKFGVNFVIIRSISDGANSDSSVDFYTFIQLASQRSSMIALELIHNIQ